MCVCVYVCMYVYIYIFIYIYIYIYVFVFSSTRKMEILSSVTWVSSIINSFVGRLTWVVTQPQRVSNNISQGAIFYIPGNTVLTNCHRYHTELYFYKVQVWQFLKIIWWYHVLFKYCFKMFQHDRSFSAEYLLLYISFTFLILLQNVSTW